MYNHAVFLVLRTFQIIHQPPLTYKGAKQHCMNKFGFFVYEPTAAEALVFLNQYVDRACTPNPWMFSVAANAICPGLLYKAVDTYGNLEYKRSVVNN